MKIESLGIGEAAPQFELSGVDGENRALDDFDASALVVVFTCNHCPVAKAYQDRIKALQAGYNGADVVAINPNDAEGYPEDFFENMVERAETEAFHFPCLRDESQDVAEAYGAEATPHAFVFDEEHRLVYQGAIDDDRDGEDVTEQYVRAAVNAVIADEAFERDTVSPMGCSIKWKSPA